MLGHVELGYKKTDHALEIVLEANYTVGNRDDKK